MNDGILLVDKPKGWSSFDVIRKLRTVIYESKVKSSKSKENSKIINHKSKIKLGHAGTLDPMATGLLIILFGKATKQQQRFMKLDKVYEAEITLGATSSTEDAEGEIVASSKQKVASSKQIEEVLRSFTGEQQQVSSSHSALKVGGQRAYKLARAGKPVQLEARTITIYSIGINSYSYPVLNITCRVSSGTYIRALARDIGEALGTGAYLSALRRTEIGNFLVEEAITPEIDTETLQNRLITDY